MTSDVQRARQRDRAADDRGGEGGEPVLAVDADVEQVHPEADRDRERGEVVDRSRWLTMLTHAARLGAVVPHRLERRPTGSPAATQDQRGDQRPRTASASDRGRERRARRRRRSMRRSCRLSPRAGHRRAELLGRDRAPGRPRRPAGRAGSPRCVSDRPISSSRSAEISSTASPSRRARRVRWSQIAAWAPTSTPRVGCAAISTHRVAAHLAADDQLLLVAAGQRTRRATSMPGVRTSYSSTIRSVSARAPARSINGPRDVGRLGSGGRGCGSPTAARRAAGRAGAGPRGCSRCRPRGGRRVDQVVMSSSPSAIGPAASGRMPMIVSTSSAWPLPSTPAMPSTSPAVDRRRTMSASSGAAVGGRARVRPSTAQHDRVGDGRLARSRASAARCRPSARRAGGR